MANYKVGDLASLFPSPQANKAGKDLQSLFKDHYSNKKTNMMKKKGKKSIEQSSHDAKTSPNIKKEADSSDLISEVKEKVKKEKSNLSENDTPFIRSTKKQKSKKLAKMQEDNVKTESDAPFVRRKKKQRVEMSEENSTDDDAQSPKDTKDDLFFYDSAPNYVIPEDEEHLKPVKKLKSKKKKDMQKQVPSTKPEKGSSEDDNEENSSNNNYPKKGKMNHIDDDLKTTVFVGNLPKSTNEKMLWKIFRRFGLLKTVRLRGAVPLKSTMPKKVAQITNQYHESMKSHIGYVVYKDRESAEKALSLNGTLICDHHIKVDFATQAGQKKTYNDNLSIFIGNLPFDVDDESIWSTFEGCGDIQSVRVIRDKATGFGKGFGYVQFAKFAGKQQALAMEDVEINGRTIRIQNVNTNPQKSTAKLSAKAVRSTIARKRSKDAGGKKKSVKKLLKKEKRFHQNKKIANILGRKLKK